MLVMAPAKKTGKGKAGNVPKQKFEEWIHAQVTDPVVWDHFVKMVQAHQGGRSAFVRWLIEREWARRATGPLSQPSDTAAPDAEARQDNGTVHWIGKKTEGDEGEGKSK